MFIRESRLKPVLANIYSDIATKASNGKRLFVNQGWQMCEMNPVLSHAWNNNETSIYIKVFALP